MWYNNQLLVFNIFLEILFEIHLTCTAVSDGSDGFAHCVVAFLYAFVGLTVVGCTLSADTEVFRSFDRVNVSCKEDELPIILLIFNDLQKMTLLLL